jgi:hypothetical protein
LKLKTDFNNIFETGKPHSKKPNMITVSWLSSSNTIQVSYESSRVGPSPKLELSLYAPRVTFGTGSSSRRRALSLKEAGAEG